MARRRRKKKSNIGGIVISFLMIFLMIASVASIALYRQQPVGGNSYDGIDFEADSSGLFVADLGGNEIRTGSLPQHTLGIPVDRDAIMLIRSSPVLILTFDPTVEADQLQFTDFVRFELAAEFSNFAGATTVPSTQYTLPVRTCENASAAAPVVYLKEGSRPQITRDDYCITLEGNRSTMLLAKDALIFHYYDVYTPEDLNIIPVPQNE